jgi:hypothetical protein
MKLACDLSFSLSQDKAREMFPCSDLNIEYSRFPNAFPRFCIPGCSFVRDKIYFAQSLSTADYESRSNSASIDTKLEVRRLANRGSISNKDRDFSPLYDYRPDVKSSQSPV